MKTRTLYYEDCHLRQFTARVLDCEKTEKGYWVELDQTAFFPEGGGQACDIGTLGTARVLAVKESEDRVLHLCDSPLEKGQEVVGSIDWDRRFDQMQQHAGEHILSGLIHETYGYHNVGFHVGAEIVQVDFDGMIPQEDIPGLELQVNRIIWENRPIHCWYPSREELPQVQYRTKRELPWPVRIVQIQGADTCACCGVHVGSTGEIGMVKLLSCVKFHQGVRIEMVCGGRALDILGRVFEQNRQVCQAFSAKRMETGEAARRMNEALAAEKYRAAALEKQVFACTAAQYRNRGDVLHFAEDLTPGSLRDLAEAIAVECGGMATVFCAAGEDRYNVCIVNKSGDVKEYGQRLCKALNGKGGGKPGHFQGSLNCGILQIQEFICGEK